MARPRYPMPSYIKQALLERDLMEEYKQRPPYQQNDYIGWIERAKREETKETKDKRLSQMLQELEEGGVYMKMNHLPSRKK